MAKTEKTTKEKAKELKEKAEKIVKEIEEVVKGNDKKDVVDTADDQVVAKGTEKKEELGFFARIWAWIKNFFANIVARIKGLFS